ncbi:MAG: tRNA epoxyqueuosine(34) reductase QueG [Bacteroidales bacterium]|nr:tRNA epoxyqueuosine(34) reductase QueG [Bacteroidales bacterium]
MVEHQNGNDKAAFIKQQAIVLGFSQCGISPVEHLAAEESVLKQWLKEDCHAGMKFMENHLEKRVNPSLLVDGAKSVISVTYNYFPEKIIPEEDNYKISKYAYGPDYHDVIKKMLYGLAQIIEQEYGAFNYRAFTDSAPVMDKVWASRSGLGWIGKNTCLISRKYGSFFFIGHLIVDFDLKYDQSIGSEYCGSCSRCIDACPTQAITKAGWLDSNRCISYLTIENRDPDLPNELKEKFQDWIFGCDICQDVCPWNKFKLTHPGADINAHPDVYAMKKADWQELDETRFQELFRKKAVKRTKFVGLKRNIEFLKE